MAKVALINPGEVNVTAIEDIVVAADLPNGEIRLVIGDNTLSTDLQAVTIPRAFASIVGHLYGLAHFTREPWDCGVIVGAEWSARQREFPAYFAYLLGHEFGHASTVLTDLRITAYEDMILRFIEKVVPHRKWRWDDMPHEVRYDQFGVAVAEAAVGRDALEEDFARIMSTDLSEDSPRLEKALRLTPRKDLNGLREDLANFALPYREDLVAAWDTARRNGDLRIAEGLPDLDSLWCAS